MKLVIEIICVLSLQLIAQEASMATANITSGNLAHRAHNLWSTKSSSSYRFPSWVANEFDEFILPSFGHTAVIYHGSDNLPEVRSMAVFREPTNIAMDRKGSRRTLDEFYQTVVFGCENGDDNAGDYVTCRTSNLFQRLFPENKFSNNESVDLAIDAYYRNQKSKTCQASQSESNNPNTCNDSSRVFRKNLEGAYRFTNKTYRMPQIAAYAKTPMRYVINDHTYTNDEGVHVLSIVGAGFDTWHQPDYQYFFDKKTQDIRNNRMEEFYEERQLSFLIALQCAFDHKLDRIEFVPVGAGAFSIRLPEDKVLDLLHRAWESEKVQSYKSLLEKQLDKEIHFSFKTEPPFSHNNGLGPGIPSFYKESGWTGEGHGTGWEDAIERTLFINAWDPWSLVGNENEFDHSVDGMYGRQSALSLLCWPVTNPFVQYKRIEF